MALTEDQKKQLQKCSAAQILKYIDQGVISYPEDFTIDDPAKREEVERQLQDRPNPMELKEWAAIEPILNTEDPSLPTMLGNYISHWQTTMPKENHVDQAKELLMAIEEKEWSKVDLLSEDSMLNYLSRYPQTVHRSVIDNNIWQMALNNLPTYGLDPIYRYKNNFPNGEHQVEADNIISDYAEWDSVKYSEDIFKIDKYIDNHSNSSFIYEARNIMNRLKAEMIEEMKSNPAGFNRDMLLRLVSEEIFTDKELYSKGVMSKEAYERLLNYKDIKESLPDLSTSLGGGANQCTPGNTDVYLFGIPSTGKTCVLMGLVSASGIDINLKRAGGGYAADLQLWIETGMTPDSTPHFVTTIEANITRGQNNHKVNLVEMSGEEFARKLADNKDDNTVSLADMGQGAAELLRNKNRKVFFFIIDPTVETVTGTHHIQETETRTDENGETFDVIVEERDEKFMVSQRITLQKMINLLDDPSNEATMKCVDSIHFIVTKADTMAEFQDERSQRAFERFRSRYSQLVNPLVRMCEKYGINRATGGYPKLYTFSLGKFYPGGIYEYSDADAQRLINVISGNTVAEKQQGFWDRFKAAVN